MADRDKPVVNLNRAMDALDELWQPQVLAQMNDNDVRIARIKGEFIWHTHDDTDELFMVMRGRMRIEMPERTVTLEQGDVFVVPKGVRHKPVAEEDCWILLIEPSGTINTGAEQSSRTAARDVWVE